MTFDEIQKFAAGRRGTTVALDFMVLEAIRANSGVSMKRLEDLAGVAPKTLRTSTDRLIDRGLIRKEP